MNSINNGAFTSLFRAACQKCFGSALTGVLSETESKHLSNVIFDSTGLVIGAKSLKNYSGYVIGNTESKQENPSVATLDTLARYVLGAPYTDEVSRKEKEAHYPYWFQYKNTVVAVPAKAIPGKRRKPWIIVSVAGIIVLAVVLLGRLIYPAANLNFTDNFRQLGQDSLLKNGWFLEAEDSMWWDKRNVKQGYLTLFTLRGDNWPDTANAPHIKNLLVRKIPGDCFTAEIHLDSFIPGSNWQQAGLLLMEDSSLTSRTIRLSLSYNDFFGGFSKSPEIIIQAISSGGKPSGNPEEIAHLPVYSVTGTQDSLVTANLHYSALRIEKKNNHFRFLYSASPVQNFAFKEAFSKDLSITPKYIAIFALEGFVANQTYIPVQFNYFNLSGVDCNK